MGLLSDGRVLEVTQALPTSLVANAVAVQEANREYQERALGREGLRRMYIGTLTLSLVLAVFGAILLAVVLGNSLARMEIQIMFEELLARDVDLVPNGKPEYVRSNFVHGFKRVPVKRA